MTTKPSKFPGFTVTRDVAPYDVAVALCSGFEGGIGYWAEIVGYKEPASLDVTLAKLSAEQYDHAKEDTSRVYRYIDYPLNKGGAVILRDCEGSEGCESWTLTLAKIKTGLQIMADKYPNHFNDLVGCNGDAITGDVFIQCCLFGEIVYG